MTKTILAIDSAIGISSCAVWRGGKVAAYLENRESTMQAANLVPLIEETLKAASLTYNDLTLVASTVGPGSFTGIRIALATARAIAFAAGIPCVGYTTLEVMAYATWLASLRAGGEAIQPAAAWIAASAAPPRNDVEILAILNAGKGEVFYQLFGKEKIEPAIGKLEEVLQKYPQATVASSMSPAAITHPRADALAKLAAENPEAALPPSPFYIRPPDAKPQASCKL